DGRPGAPRLVDVTRSSAPGLDETGMVSGAAWADLEDDGDPDLITAAEWGPVTVWTNDGGRFMASPIDGTDGLWQSIEVADLDADGDLDIVAANWGLNSRLQVGEGPLRLHVGDFDGNGRNDPLLSVYNRGRSLPFALRNELVGQLPSLKREYLTPSTYVGKTVEDLLTPAQLERAEVYQASQLASVALVNDGGWSVRRLPFEVQLAPMNAALVLDADRDGTPDLLLAGNRDDLKPDLGRQMSSPGVFLRGTNGGLAPSRSGFRVPGQTRHLVALEVGGRTVVVAVRNDAAPVVFALEDAAVAAR
ncbi:FG-GAP-like repeat-containing protein, partial [Rubrivirga sp.]|uniref:FG-GAP-like repeat-containing protein n=1 Tax=Rubrivirga sp. TaxID=1885344 RepID=UPI003C796242